MKCAICGAPTRVLATRYDIRVRNCAAGHRMRTREVVEAVARRPVGRGRGRYVPVRP